MSQLTAATPLGALIECNGFFTIQKAIQGRSLREIEKLLGFNTGRLQQGAWFVVATELPSMDGFRLAGYTQVSKEFIPVRYPGINAPKDRFEEDAYRIRKKMAMAAWSLTGSERLVKVIPVSRVGDYPPGLGIPQWEMTRPLTCRLMAFVPDFPDGRFIPDAGFYHVR